MQPLIWDRRPDGLRAPAMVCAFEGWNDAGDAASSAVSFLASALDARRFARIDSEEFYDFQANRPRIRFDENETREIEWPTVEIFEASAPRAPRDLVLVQGVEPSMRWRAFSTHMVDLAEALGVQVVVSLGALLGDVPHTRPVALSGHASDAALLERLGLQASSYEGPTGIVGVLHTACAQAGLPSASLWASVPHYVAAAANPKAALALLRRVEVLIGVSVDVIRAGILGRGLRAPGRDGGAQRPRHPSVRGTPGAGGGQRGAEHARGPSVRGHPRQRIPALSAPKGPGRQVAGAWGHGRTARAIGPSQGLRCSR